MISLQEPLRNETDIKQKTKPQGRKLKCISALVRRTNQPGLVWGSKPRLVWGSKELEREQTVIQL